MAPAARSARTARRWPRSAAAYSAVVPFEAGKCTSAPQASRILRDPMSPRSAAVMSGVVPWRSDAERVKGGGGVRKGKETKRKGTKE